jgi:hypothetical protein
MLRTASRLVLMAGVVAAGTAGAMAMRADLLIGYGFNKAFEAHSGAAPFQVAADRPDGSSTRAEVGDEAYWLQSGDSIARPVVMTGRPVVGQRIVYVSATDGRTLYLEVVAVNFVGSPIVNASMSDGPAAVWLMRVTFRVLVPPGAGTEKEELVHLWFQTEAKPVPTRAQERASPRST